MELMHAVAVHDDWLWNSRQDREMRHATCDMQDYACKMRNYACDMWTVSYEMWNATCEMWNALCDMCFYTCDMWNVSCEMLSAQFCTFIQTASWLPCWIKFQNSMLYINNRCCVILVSSFIDNTPSWVEKPVITYKYLLQLSAHIWTFMQIASWWPY